jgi:hypothetical protein
MAHPNIVNGTPFVLEPLHLLDEQCRPLLVPVLKGTFRIQSEGRCELADEQVPLSATGECFGEDPATSSYRYEPEVAFHKPATDVVLVGHAYAPAPRTRQMLVDVRVGALHQQLLVTGDRVWFQSAGMPAISEPLVFERMPLVYERAFGGWDRTDPDPERHAVELRNPVGTGFRRHGFEEGVRLPNLEQPHAPIRTPTDKPTPAGVGFTSPHWQPRAQLAGTYDEAWQKHRSPLLPKDFDRSHFNAASLGLIAPGYLRGDESAVIVGMTPAGSLELALPGVQLAPIRVGLRSGERLEVPLALDTVIIEPDEQRLMLLWRGHVRLPNSPHDVAEVEATAPLAWPRHAQPA